MIQHLTSKNTTQQLIDYYLSKEIIRGKRRGYARRIQGKLSAHNINVSQNYIYQKAKSISTGKRVLTPAADVDGTPSTREGKDQNYAGFWALVDVHIPDKERRNYIGLAANQIDIVRSKVDGKLVVCELNRTRYNSLCRLKNGLKLEAVKIVNRNIFDEMIDWSYNYGKGLNVIDLDLMCSLPQNEKGLEEISHALWEAIWKEEKAVINLTTVLGHSINSLQYTYNIGRLEKLIEKYELKIEGKSSFGYRDRQTPMRAERYLLKNKR